MFNKIENMLNYIQSSFTIKDLENLSGIKAHTLRIWEKRYELFSPVRDENNIRSYDLASLQKLFNVVFLLNQGMKISHIAEMPRHEISSTVKRYVLENEVESYAINNLKLAMLNFDSRLFSETYQLLIKEKPFKEILYSTFFPFLYQIGLLWQTGTLSPAHEHFISNLIKQKLLLNIEKLEFDISNENEVYVLFLPHKEIHEIGLLAVNFELKLLSKNTIYLGESIPVQDLVELANKAPNIHFISYFTIYPEDEILHEYLSDFQKSILKGRAHKLWIGGYKARFVSDFNLENVSSFENINELIKKISE